MSTNKIKLGDKDIPFVFRGGELIYPNPIKDGLVLWYDFSGRTNADSQRGIAEDLSGNGNNGTLRNFNYTVDSGHNKNKLLFDGVDDYITTSTPMTKKFTWSATLTPHIEDVDMMFMTGNQTAIYFRIDRNKLSASTRGETNATDYTRTDFLVNKDVTYHFDFVYDNGGYKIYANGEEVGEGSNSKLDEEYALRYIGQYIDSDPRAFTGNIHSVQVYNRPLTPEEIQHNYQIEKERFIDKPITPIDTSAKPIGEAQIAHNFKVGGDL